MKKLIKIEFSCVMIARTTDSTLSRLFVTNRYEDGTHDDRGLCFILEDGIRAEKVHGQTCIPELVEFSVEPTRQSKFYEAYRKNATIKALFAIALENVPGFSKIRVHGGTTKEDTLGCPLTGMGAESRNGNFVTIRSIEALARVYAVLNPVFDEKTIKFTIPVTWTAYRRPLIDLIQKQ